MEVMTCNSAKIKTRSYVLAGWSRSPSTSDGAGQLVAITQRSVAAVGTYILLLHATLSPGPGPATVARP